MSAKLAESETIGDLLKRLGNVPARRVRLRPTPGTATELDVLRFERKTGRLCELIDGTLVEKTMGEDESFLALELAGFVNQFVKARKLGWMTGEQGPYRLFADSIRMPDLAFVSWARCPGRRRPRQPISPVIPDLAIEILSRNNTRAEMTRKCQDYFTAGVRSVWIVDPKKRTVQVYTATDESTLLHEADTLTSEPVLPGFKLPLRELFGELDRHG